MRHEKVNEKNEEINTWLLITNWLKPSTLNLQGSSLIVTLIVEMISLSIFEVCVFK